MPLFIHIEERYELSHCPTSPYQPGKGYRPTSRPAELLYVALVRRLAGSI